jgi:predicted unusual protein kinase regulating ubiquinone biosynthesis (AarF/ABC1/UbiB family)
MSEIIKQIIFFCNIGFILSSEALFYLIFGNYLSCIKSLTTRLSSINILYVKIFQAIASNNSLIDEKINNELLKFTDNAPWDLEDIRVTELIEICEKYDLVIKDGFEHPINSGMISLVYKAFKRCDHTPVIIKMKRNNIENRLNDAIENLKTFMYLLSFIPIIHKYQISNVITKNIEIIRHQTNFNEEVDNINKIRNNCKHLKYVKIPEVYLDATNENPNFILMEYIDGKKINEINDEDYYAFSKVVLKFGLLTTVIHGAAHGDLHSGNILFIKDKDDKKYPHKIGVIDFGIIYDIDPTYKVMLSDFFINVFERTARESIVLIANSGMVDPPNIINCLPKEHYDTIINLGTVMFADILTGVKQANQLEIYKFLSMINEYLSRPELAKYGIKPSDNFVKMQLVLAMSHGVTLTLCKDNILNLTNEVLNELFHTNMLTEDE